MKFACVLLPGFVSQHQGEGGVVDNRNFSRSEVPVSSVGGFEAFITITLTLTLRKKTFEKTIQDVLAALGQAGSSSFPAAAVRRPD